MSASGRTVTDRTELTQPRKLGPNYFRLFGASTISNLGDGIGIIAYPWLASAVTRNPVLIALVAVAQRLPWLLFTLPAGVITDRNDRRVLMISSNVVRTILTIGVAIAVLGRQGSLPGPEVVADATIALSSDVTLYVVILVATLLMGMAEVLYDNSAQTFMPAIVHTDQLEKANGRLWSIEMVANTFVGPPLGALLIAVSFSLPFFADAATFAVSAALIALIPRTSRSTAVPEMSAVSEIDSARNGTATADGTEAADADGTADHADSTSTTWRSELAEGFRWLWSHELLRPMAIILGILNALGTLTFAAFVLFAQEILHTSATEFALLESGGAVGGIVGGWTASSISRRIGPGPSLALTLVSGGVTTLAIGFLSWWPLVWLMFSLAMFVGVLWNVITVSLRQAIIPDRLLGRVNSVYRFFAWGMMPIGSILGGLIIVVTERLGSRELALRMPWVIAGAAHFVLLVFAAPRLTTARIEAARVAGSELPTAPI
jgi:MFS family permease